MLRQRMNLRELKYHESSERVTARKTPLVGDIVRDKGETKVIKSIDWPNGFALFTDGTAIRIDRLR